MRLSNVDMARLACALMVAINHCLMVLPSPNPWLLATIGNGSFSVCLFFVLSGFFVSSRIDKAGLDPVRLFLWRAGRILPLHWLTLAVITMVLLIGIPHVEGSAWFNTWYAHPVTLGEFARNLTLLSPSLNSITWTLWYEMAFILWAVPLYWITKRVGFYGSLGVWLTLYGLDIIEAPAFNFADLIYRFYPGVILYVYRRKWPLWLGIIPILAMPYIHPGQRHAAFDPMHLMDLLNTVGTFATASFLVLSPQIRLNVPNISWPFFLTHFFVMYLMVVFWNPSTWILAVSSIGVALGMSLGLHRLRLA